VRPRRQLIALGIVALFAGAVTDVEAVSAGLPRPTAGPHVYVDPVGDAPDSPDIASVAVVDDVSGRLTLEVSFANRTGLLPSDLLVVGLDVDRDQRTGGPLGMDYALSGTAMGAELGVWASFSCCGSGYLVIPGAAQLSNSGDSVLLTTTVDRLGALMTSQRPRLRSVLIAIAGIDQAEQSQADDVAGPWTYEIKRATVRTRTHRRPGTTHWATSSSSVSPAAVEGEGDASGAGLTPHF